MTEFVMVHCAAASAEEAEAIAARLLDGRLAACVHIVPVVSCYVWKGERAREAEHLMIVKTRAERFDDVAECIRAAHSYDTPEITAAPLTAVDPRYAAWMREATAPNPGAAK